MTCWPFLHRYVPVSARVTEDVSFGRLGIISTNVLRVCERCGRFRTRSVGGEWTLAEIQGRPTRLFS